MAGEFSPGAGASAGFSAWAESTLWVPERRGLGSRGTVGDLFPLPGPQSLSRSSCSLPPTLASDTDNLSLIHMLSGTRPDTHLHRHTHLRTQYTSRLHTAYTPRPETATSLPASETSPRRPALLYVTRSWPLPAPRAPTLHCQRTPSGAHSPPCNHAPPQIHTAISGTSVRSQHTFTPRDTPSPPSCIPPPSLSTTFSSWS